MLKLGRIFLSVFAMTIATVSLPAQPAEPMSVRFTCLSWDKIDSKDLGYLKQGQLMPLRMSSSYRGEVYTYTGPNPIVFYRGVGMADGSVQRTPVASVTIPSGMHDVLLLFIANNDAQPGQPEFNVVVIDDSTTSFPWGSYHIYNLSAYEIGGIFGNEKFTIPGKKSKIVIPNADDQVDVQIHFSQKIDGQWVPKVNTRWLYRANARSIIFVTDDMNARFPRIKIKSIDQYQAQAK